MAASSSFPPELRTMSIVPRWSIVHVTQKDTVANHSYYVTVYAAIIARIAKWDGPRDYLMFSALLHDLDETVTGDVVGPIKEYILDRDRMDDFVDRKISDRFMALMLEIEALEPKNAEHMKQADAIIKAADRLDAVLFLIMEQRRGNSTIAPLIRTATARLEAAWRELPMDQHQIDYTWQINVLPAIAAHHTQGGQGI